MTLKTTNDYYHQQTKEVITKLNLLIATNQSQCIESLIFAKCDTKLILVNKDKKLIFFSSKCSNKCEAHLNRMVAGYFLRCHHHHDMPTA